MAILPVELIKTCLEWALGCPCNPSRPLLKATIPSDVLDFVWSMYILARCRPSDCPCASRAECIMSTVLLQSATIENVLPWCSRINFFCVEGDRHESKVLQQVKKLIQLPLNLQAVFVGFASCGFSEGLRFIKRNWNLTRADIVGQGIYALMTADALMSAAENGHLPVLQFLTHDMGVTVDDAREELGRVSRPFKIAAAMGHVSVLKFLHQEWNLTAADARDDENYALICAAGNGHRHVLEFLHRVCKLTTNDARAQDNRALKVAALNGHLSVLKFLAFEWNLTAEDARSDDNIALVWAALHGHVSVLDFMLRTWNLTAADARSRGNRALQLAASNGHVDVLDFLHRTWNLSAEDVRGLDNLALVSAAKNGHVDVMDFLYRTWHLVEEDARAQKDQIWRIALKKNQTEVLEFIGRTWNIGSRYELRSLEGRQSQR